MLERFPNRKCVLDRWLTFVRFEWFKQKKKREKPKIAIDSDLARKHIHTHMTRVMNWCERFSKNVNVIKSWFTRWTVFSTLHTWTRISRLDILRRQAYSLGYLSARCSFATTVASVSHSVSHANQCGRCSKFLLLAIHRKPRFVLFSHALLNVYIQRQPTKKRRRNFRINALGKCWSKCVRIWLFFLLSITVIMNHNKFLNESKAQI